MEVSEETMGEESATDGGGGGGRKDSEMLDFLYDNLLTEKEEEDKEDRTRKEEKNGEEQLQKICRLEREKKELEAKVGWNRKQRLYSSRMSLIKVLLNLTHLVGEEN